LYTFIETIENLAFLNQELIRKPYLAIDTEFRRTTKDNMKLGLLQINDGEETFLVDTIKIIDPHEHAGFLSCSSVLKILHSCKEDLEAVYSWTNQRMSNIYDTQVANSFLGGEFSVSYQSLVERELGIVLEKKETRSNWLRRPLTDSQLKYASLDVEYLIHLYLEQKSKLIASNKLDWHDQDILKMIDATFTRMPLRELKRTIPKAQENELLNKLNKIVQSISKQESINPTLFFSKKSQKEFLRLVMSQGLKPTLNELSDWRKRLIEKEILEILK
tara:strand:+ start:157 stop:981 length:825 start_codon:yes stop_codon:yes gene_type:complete